jgi:hypothetical protein
LLACSGACSSSSSSSGSSSSSSSETNCMQQQTLRKTFAPSNIATNPHSSAGQRPADTRAQHIYTGVEPGIIYQPQPLRPGLHCTVLFTSNLVHTYHSLAPSTVSTMLQPAEVSQAVQADPGACVINTDCTSPPTCHSLVPETGPY